MNRKGSRFLSIFNRYYAYCSVSQTCALVPPITTDTEFYSGSVYYARSKPQDPTYYWLHKARQVQAVAQRPEFLLDIHKAKDLSSSKLFMEYHEKMLLAEKQAGRMMTTVIGINERVSPDEMDEESLFSIYHRTTEWTRKKEIGVMVFNSFPTKAKEIITIPVATPDLCAYNSAKMHSRQQLTCYAPDMCELTIPMKINANGYTTFILKFCDGAEKAEGEATEQSGQILDGDVFRVGFDEKGHFRTLINKLNKITYNIDADLAIVRRNENQFVPHQLDSTDALYINPVFFFFKYFIYFSIYNV
jgi:hypothetical protein